MTKTKRTVKQSKQTKADKHTEELLRIAAVQSANKVKEREAFDKKAGELHKVYDFDCNHYRECMGYQGQKLMLAKFSRNGGEVCFEEIKEIDGLNHWARAEELWSDGLLENSSWDKGAKETYFRTLAAMFS
jgi:hypothetical protein